MTPLQSVDLGIAIGGITKVERRGPYWVKRDDTFRFGAAHGAKARAILKLLTCYPSGVPRLTLPAGVVTLGSRHSVQIAVATLVCRELGLKLFVHVPDAAEHSDEIDAVLAAGFEVCAHRPGYNSVIRRRAADQAAALGYQLLPQGLVCEDAIDLVAAQTVNIPADVTRVVVCGGSGTTAAGVLRGLRANGRSNPVDIQMVGMDCRAVFEDAACAYTAAGGSATVYPPTSRYDRPAPLDRCVLHGLELDAYYEAKAAALLHVPNSLLWNSGLRQDWKHALRGLDNSSTSS